MQYDATRRQVVRCSNCRGENFEFASFCISCGEPLDDPSGSDFVPSSSIAPPAAGQSEPTVSLGMASTRRLWRVESAIGLLLLIPPVRALVRAGVGNAVMRRYPSVSTTITRVRIVRPGDVVPGQVVDPTDDPPSGQGRIES